MDNRLKRFLSLALAMVMVIGMMPANIVFATENGGNLPDSGENVVADNNTDETPDPVPPMPPEQDPAQVPAVIAEHTCEFTIPVAGSVKEATASDPATQEMECKDDTCEKTLRVKIACPTECRFKDDPNHAGDCLCNRSNACTQPAGHPGLCVGNGNTVLILSGADLVHELQSKSEVTLTQDLVLSETLVIPADVNSKLNLNNKSIALKSDSSSKYALNNLGILTIAGNGTVQGIKNGAETGTNAQLTIGEENSSAGTFDATDSDSYAVLNYDEVTINKGDFNANGHYALGNASGAEMDIENGTITGVYNEGDLDITNGTFDAAVGKHTVYSFKGDLYVENGTFIKGQSDTGIAVIKVGGISPDNVQGNSTATLVGGSFSNTADGLALDVATTHTDGVTIGVNAIVDGGITVGDDAKLTIEGGSFEDADADNSYVNNGTVVIEGGSFVGANAQAFAADHVAEKVVLLFKTGTNEREVVKHVYDDGSKVMEDVVAKIGTAGYPTLEQAIADGENGTIVLQQNVTVNNTIPVDNDVDLNMNGKTIYSNITTGRIFDLISTGNCANFTLRGGKIENYVDSNNQKNESGRGVIDINKTATVKVEDCTINLTTSNGALIRGYETTNGYASLTLKDVDATTNYWIFSTDNDNGKMNSVTVQGGSYRTSYGAFYVNAVSSVNFTGATINAVDLGVAVHGNGDDTQASFVDNTIKIAAANTATTVRDDLKGYIIAVSGKVNATINTTAEEKEFHGIYGVDSYADGKIGAIGSNANLTISDGVFYGTVAANSQGKVTIEGGNFNNFAVNNKDVNNNVVGSVSISGGRFEGSPVGYLAPYYKAVEDPKATGWFDVLRKNVDGQKASDFKVVGAEIDANTTTAIATAIINSVENSTSAVTGVPSGSTLVIKLKEITAENTDAGVKVTKIKYDVTPLPAYEGKPTIKFRLPIPKAYVNGYVSKADVYHGTEKIKDEFQFTKEANGGEWYAELEATSFSEYTIDLIDIDFNSHVARIGNKGYGKVDYAVEAVQDGETIELMTREGATGIDYGQVDYTLTNKSFTIDGKGYLWSDNTVGSPTIKIRGGYAADPEKAMVTIQNVRFATNRNAGSIIDISSDGKYSNVVIEGCSFEGNYVSESTSTIVGIKLENTKGVVIRQLVDSENSANNKNNTGSKLSTFLKNTGSSRLQIQNVDIQNCGTGLTLGAVADVTVANVSITNPTTRTEYGISLEAATANFNAVFNGCTIDAFIPVMVFNTDYDGTIEFKGTNALTPLDGSYWCVLADAPYVTTSGSAETMTTNGKHIIVKVSGSLLSKDGVGINEKHFLDGATVDKYYTVAPAGDIDSCFVFDESTSNDSRLSCEISGLEANETVVMKVYDEAGKELATSELVKMEHLRKNDLTGIVAMSYASSSWNTTWKTDEVTKEKVPTYKTVPYRITLVVDEEEVSSALVEMNRREVPDDEKRVWTDFEGVGNLTLTEDGKTTWKHTLAEAFDAVKENGTVTLYADNDIDLPANGEITGDKTVTITGTGTLDWGTGWLFVGRGENASGNGKLIFDKANITAAGTEPSKLGFNVSGMRNQGGTPTGDGNITIKGGSNVEVDYVVNRNVINVTGKGTKLTIRNGIAVGGRPKTEVAGATVDQTAKVNVDGGAILHVKYDNNEGLGEEGIGVLNVKDATFISDGTFHVEWEDGSEIRVSGTSTLKIKKLDGRAVAMLDGAKLVNSQVGGEVAARSAATEPAEMIKVYFAEKNTIDEVTVDRALATISGELNADLLFVDRGTVYTDTESKINAQMIRIGDGDEIKVDATKLADGTAVRVINQTKEIAGFIGGRVSTIVGAYVVHADDDTEDKGDVVVSKVDRTEVYFNPDYERTEAQQFGDKVADGRYQGVNAFDKFKNTSDNKLVLPQETKTVVLAIGNKETASYGKLYSMQNLIVKTEGSGNDKYAVVDMVRNGNGNLTIEKDHKIKVLGGKGNSGADKQGGVFTINGEVLVANGNFKLWRNDDTHLGKLVVGANGNLTLEDGNVENVGQITINGAGKVDVKNGDVKNGDVQNGGAIVIDGTGQMNVKNGTIANTGTITMDYTSDIVAKNITGNGTITIDTTGMVAVTKVKVIELSGNATTKALMESSSVKILKDAAAKYVGADGDVYVYYEAFVDRDKDNTLDLNEGYASIEKAIAAATDGQTVVLLADAETASVTIQKSLTLNLNGHKITKTAPLYVDGSQKAVTVTVSNGTITGSDAGIVMRKNATLNVNTGAKIAGEPAIQVYGGNLNVNGGEIVGGTNAISTSFNAAAAYVGNAAVKISSGKVTGKIILEDAKTGYAAPAGYIASLTITGGTFQKNDLDQDYITKNYGSIAVSGGTFDKFVPYEMCAMDYLCQQKANSNLFEVIHSPHRRVYMKYVDDQDAKVTVGGEAYFDGKAYKVMTDKVVLLDLEQAKKPEMFITTYQYNPGNSADVEDDFPAAMYVWYAVGKNPNNAGVYTSYEVERVAVLDNFFLYNGTSIRVGGSDNGIRFFSSVNSADANKLMTGTLITDAGSKLLGAKMTQAGTEFWKTVGKELRSEVYGGAVGNMFRIFQNYQGRDWFTGVLVGLGKDKETTIAPFYSRPYAEINVGGKTVTLYGGTLTRSIYYVATQNKDVFAPGSVYDNFVEGLIALGAS